MLSILIPIYNEAPILEQSVSKVHAYLSQRDYDFEILVVNNGSTDNSAELCAKLAAQYPWFRYATLVQKGVGKAFALGVEQARGDQIVSLDCDLSFDLRFIDYAHDLLRYCDMVVGSKTMGKQRRSALRVVASQFYIMFAQLCFGLTISDYSIGCKAYRREAILKALPHIDSWTGYVLELSIFLELHDRRMIQVGVDCDDRRKSKFNLLHEGFYRYYHLYRCLRLSQDPRSWFHGDRP